MLNTYYSMPCFICLIIYIFPCQYTEAYLSLYKDLIVFQASLMAQMINNLPAMQETWVPSLGQDDSMEKGMATHSSVLAWRIPWTEEPGRLQSVGLKESDMIEWLSNTHTIVFHGHLICDYLQNASKILYFIDRILFW